MAAAHHVQAMAAAAPPPRLLAAYKKAKRLGEEKWYWRPGRDARLTSACEDFLALVSTVNLDAAPAALVAAGAATWRQAKANVERWQKDAHNRSAANLDANLSLIELSQLSAAEASVRGGVGRS